MPFVIRSYIPQESFQFHHVCHKTAKCMNAFSTETLCSHSSQSFVKLTSISPPLPPTHIMPRTGVLLRFQSCLMSKSSLNASSVIKPLPTRALASIYMLIVRQQRRYGHMCVYTHLLGEHQSEAKARRLMNRCQCLVCYPHHISTDLCCVCQADRGLLGEFGKHDVFELHLDQ